MSQDGSQHTSLWGCLNAQLWGIVCRLPMCVGGVQELCVAVCWLVFKDCAWRSMTMAPLQCWSCRKPTGEADPHPSEIARAFHPFFCALCGRKQTKCRTNLLHTQQHAWHHHRTSTQKAASPSWSFHSTTRMWSQVDKVCTHAGCRPGPFTICTSLPGAAGVIVGSSCRGAAWLLLRQVRWCLMWSAQHT